MILNREVVNERKLVELEKNGYNLKVVEEEYSYNHTVPKVEVDYNRFNQVAIRVENEISKELDILINREYSKIEFGIQTFNFGTVPANVLTDMVNDYNKAIEAVNYFEEELAKLEGKYK